ncbi:alpha/beta fold hydrolase [Stappia sp.]|uniref:alpha/beta fold hydrolase n=1 Tax=Stappia sp. TaxID=1870903 RepID=UPI003A997BBE
MSAAGDSTAGESFIASADDGAKLKAWSHGSGRRALLLVSGLGGTGGFWKEVAPALSGDMRVLRFDQRGIGASERGSASVSIDQLARDCLSVLDAAGIERVFLLGHSTGGCIGQAFARIAPERTEGLILSAAWMRPSHYMNALFGTRRDILAHSPAAYAASAALLSHPPDWLEENWGVFEAGVRNAPATPEAVAVVRERIDALLSFDGSAQAGALTQPALVLGARDDMIVPPFLQKDLAAALPSAELRVMESGGHFFPVTRRDRTVAEISDWIGAR